jgi:apolipoprotein N-acyltransferase
LERGKFGNTALFFSPEGKVVGQYLKIRLLPFSEYIPYKDIIPWPEFIVPKEKKAFEIPGKDFNIFEVDGARFGVVICWELVFPESVREFVKNGANFMINISNEGWFGKTAAPYQMVSINVLRAVENRRAFARASNTGISCFIDPYGRVKGRVRKGKKDIFVEGYLTEEVYISEQKTFYTTYGDIFVYISQMITFFIFILSFLKTRIGLHKISSIMDNW